MEEEWGSRGWTVITLRLCYCVEPCRTVTLSQKYIWQERKREGERKTRGMKKREEW